jgi:hypothetical protein
LTIETPAEKPVALAKLISLLDLIQEEENIPLAKMCPKSRKIRK